MDYATHYQRLIDRARGRILEGYKERHHVVPRCMGGTDDPENLVHLTPEEHYVAHQLLMKIHPRNGRLVHAAVLMSTRCSGNKAYGWLRRRHAASVSESLRGNRHGLGYAHTAESKAKIAATHRGRKRSDATRSRMSASMLGNKNGLGKKLPPFTAEHRAKLSAAKSGRTLTDDHRASIGRAHLGKKWPGRVLSEAHKTMVGAFHRGRKRSAETIAKMAAARRAWWEQRRAA